MYYYIQAFKNYANFNGRATRSEYWYFILFNFLISLVISFIEGFLGIDSTLSGLYILVALIPGLSLFVRRLHDIGVSGWHILLFLIPLVNLILVFVYLTKDSEQGSNKYGPNPKGSY